MVKDIISDIISKKILVSTDKSYLKLFDSLDISMYGGIAWSYTLQTIGLKKGKDYLFDLGLLMGKDAADEINEIIKKRKGYLSKDIQLINNLIEMTGFGIVNISSNEKEINLNVINNPFLNYAKELYGKESIVCNFYAGVYSGFIEILMEIKNCKLEIKECICKNNEKSSFIYKK